MNFRSGQPVKPEFNIANLIDVLLVLVIFFMLSTTFIFQPGLMVKLPMSTYSESPPHPGAQILITKDEDIYFEKIHTTMDELEEKMQQFTDKSLLMIKADQAVTHGIVVSVMNHAKNAGFQHLAIATKPD
jgi:biopolymer transport protein ExbD